MGTSNKYNPLLKKGIQKIRNESPTLIDATVGIGGDYLTVKEAVDDNKWRLKIISDITMEEELPLTSESKLLLYGNGQTVTLQGINSVRSGIYPYIYVEGLTFEMPNAEINGKAYFYYANLHTNNCEIIGSDNEQVRFAWYIKELKNSKIDMKTNILYIQMGAGGVISNLEIYGNSTVCQGFKLTGVKADNVRWHGTFQGISGFLYKSQGIFNNFDFSAATGGCTIRPNTVFNSAKRLRLINAEGVVVNNSITVSIGGVDYGFYNFGSHDCIFNNCESTHFPYSELYGQDNVYNNCKFSDNLKYVLKNNPTFNNCEFNGNLITTRSYIYGDNIQMNNCKFNAGNLTIYSDNCNIKDITMIAGTINVNAIADKTNINNPRTLTAIVDNGTDTSIINSRLI